MNEDYLFLASVAGIALFLTSWAWLVMVSWRRRPAWGWAVLVFPPAGLLFAIRHFPTARRPFILGLVGLVMTGGPPLVNRVLPVDLGPRDTLVDGERHVTLTGWNRQDYGLLIGHSDIVVLQMANPDVNDETLRLLGDLTQLRELDLNNTKVTDSGLALLSGLPTLERLRLAHTQISETGFKDHLMHHPNLVELDLRGTEVTKDTVSAWRAAKPGRRALR